MASVALIGKTKGKKGGKKPGKKLPPFLMGGNKEAKKKKPKKG